MQGKQGAFWLPPVVMGMFLALMCVTDVLCYLPFRHASRGED